MNALFLAATLLATAAAPVIIDPATNPAGAERSLVDGPSPAGYAPLVRSASGLAVQSAVFRGRLRQDLRQTAAAFYKDLVVGADRLPDGIFLGTGSAQNALPPDKAGGTTTSF